jgi:CHAT domain-containing protein
VRRIVSRPISACKTGQVTQFKLHDESIHLVGAYQLAGFRHIVGTLWSVDDFASVQMATEMYKIMLEDEAFMTDESVCRGFMQLL